MRSVNAVFVVALLASATSAAEAATRYPLDLPGGRLGDALIALGRQAGVSVGVTDPVLANQAVRPVKGTFTLPGALRRLLRGLPARYVLIDGATIRVVRASPPLIARPSRQAAQRPRQPRPLSAMPPADLPAEEIVVTAAKRPLAIGSFPGTVDVIPGDDLQLKSALQGSDALAARLPSVTSTHFGPGRNKLFLRGIADSSFSGPTQATSGQYLGETRLNYNAPDPDLRLYDVDRIEVLSGPQGTLYGAGSLGGIVRIVPNAPRSDSLAGSLSIGASYIQHGDPGLDAAGMVNLPIASGKLALRLVGYGMTEGGYIDDAQRGLEDVNRTRIVGGRSALRAEPGGGWTIDVGVAGQRIRGDDAQFAEQDGPPLTRRSPVKQNYGNDYALGDLVVTKEWDSLRLTSAGGLVRQTLRERFDATEPGAGPAVHDQVNHITFFSFESRLVRQAAAGAGWLVGASLIRNRVEQAHASGPPQSPEPEPSLTSIVTEAAFFGEGTVRLSPRLTATAGGRLTYSHRSEASPDPALGSALSHPSADAQRSSFAFVPSAAMAIETTPSLTLFLRYQEGFRPGGLSVSRDVVRRFDADHLRSIELGARYGGSARAELNATASLVYTRWSDMQADTIDLFGRPTTTNIGDGRIYTLDLRLGWRPVSGLALEAAAVFNDSLVIDPNPGIIGAPDAPLPNISRINARLGAEYRAPISSRFGLHLSAAGRYVGQSQPGVGAILGRQQGDWFDISVAARAVAGRHAFTLTLTNLLDSAGNRFALGSPYTVRTQEQITPLRPRTLRAGWELDF